MQPLYFIRTRPGLVPSRTDHGWFALDEDRLVLDRAVFPDAGVSRSRSRCVCVRHDHDDDAWEIRNRAVGRLLVVSSDTDRYDVRTGMALTLAPGTWHGTLTGAFSFAVTSVPPATWRPWPRSEAVAAEEEPTRGREDVRRARRYLAKHPEKRFALAQLWREQFERTTDTPDDAFPAQVGRRFGVPGATITTWRAELAKAVWGATKPPQSIRDFVVQHGVMTGTDLAESDRYLDEQLRLRA